MMAYEYKNPVELGYTKVKINKKTHNKFFKNRPSKWLDKYEYYLKESDFLMHRFDSNLCIFLNIIVFPLAGLMHGFFNKELYSDYKRMLSPKKYGAFSSDKVFGNTDLYQQLISELK